VAGLSAGGPGLGPMVRVGADLAQPAVWVALQVSVLITLTVPEDGSEAYKVWVAGSIAPTLAKGPAIGIFATGAHPDRSPGWQVAPLITSTCGRLRLPA
jgi:hypothetical protein